MALTFGGAISDRVDHGSAASLDDLDPYTYLLWVYPTTLTNNRGFVGKGNTTKNFKLNGTGGNLQIVVARATTSTSYITNDTPLSTLNKWYCIATSFESAAAAGEVVNIYSGDLSTTVAERTYGTSTDGSGAVTTDASASLIVGNNASGTAFQGRIAVCLIWNRKLTLGEIKDQQFHPHKTSGCVLYSICGYNGTGTQADLSGSGNNGTVTGATQSDHVPLGPLFGFDLGYQGNFTAAAAATAYPAPRMMMGIGM